MRRKFECEEDYIIFIVSVMVHSISFFVIIGVDESALHSDLRKVIQECGEMEKKNNLKMFVEIFFSDKRCISCRGQQQPRQQQQVVFRRPQIA